MARTGTGDQAIDLKPVESHPREAVVQASLLGDVDEPHGAARVEDLDDGGRMPQVQTSHGVFDALCTGHRAAERQVGLGPVRKGTVHPGQRFAEGTELVRSPVAVVDSGDQTVGVHLGKPLADELLADEGEPGSDVTHTHGAALLRQRLSRPSGPLRCYQRERVLDALSIDRTDRCGGGVHGGGHGNELR
ncbi:hypothetical protein SCATT_27750 [Streptantibioticus cattleyicolor NRRL 8057 = DSM 46488]|uniref:Uncharacterized protein n=1 Tax=Streptantibioticus cattleyicolor (strain ATCC 35852 / DSM 46488 / JCM 4925 / NBRC 14057 / NRRL 8057) TaxID=1003195 RepID=G8WPG3_STREN|nr:hypothetical protein SCATT_27750 [Streptantibioticus cattleyicolor NRRL 8057 = DSM 46488]